MSKLVEDQRIVERLRAVAEWEQSPHGTRELARDALAHIERLQSERDELAANVTALAKRLSEKPSDSYVARLQAQLAEAKELYVTERTGNAYPYEYRRELEDDAREYFDRMMALTAQQADKGEGFVAVPVEPTPEMIEAAEDAHNGEPKF